MYDTEACMKCPIEVIVNASDLLTALLTHSRVIKEEGPWSSHWKKL